MTRPADTQPDGELEAIARSMVDEGAAGRDVVQALDQLVADRTNGEPLGVAIAALRAALTVDRRRDGQGTEAP